MVKPEELNELERKYQKFLPMPNAELIMRLIKYARELEEFYKTVNKRVDEIQVILDATKTSN